MILIKILLSLLISVLGSILGALILHLLGWQEQPSLWCQLADVV